MSVALVLHTIGSGRSLLDQTYGFTLEDMIHESVELLAAQLVQDEDDRLAGQTVIDIMTTLWPHVSPEQAGMADWWRTPLGRACARSLGREDAESISQSVAAAMLGVTRGTIAQMVHRGTLDRHPDGGVLRSSVLQRLARQPH